MWGSHFRQMKPPSLAAFWFKAARYTAQVDLAIAQIFL
jgi:hypothetical protein